MIGINELRRLAKAASHPTTKGRWIRLFGERTVYDRMEDGCRGIPVVSTDTHPPSPSEAACLDFIAAANPAVINELLDRLEAAETAWKVSDKSCYDLTEKVIPNLRYQLEVVEKDIALKERVIDSLGSELNAVANERDALQAKVETIPYGLIGKILTEVMDIAAANGADSRSMPDEYVEVAAWLCGIPCAKGE